MRSIPTFLAITGSVFLVGVFVLATTQATLGSPLFFACAALMGVAYVALLARIWRERSAPRAWMFAALAFAFAFRVPLAVLPVGADSDIVRYVWDGRVQHLGLNPYLVVPANPALTHTHTAETWQMPSRRWRTSYPPGSQLFFRAVTAVHDSAIAMKLALVLCDLITIFVVRRWLLMTGRSEWLTLAYAWNPLVVLEVAHSGHIDALGAMWIAMAALALTARWTMIASVLAVIAIATKLLPVVLVPLFWRRVRWRDVAVATLAGLLMAWPFLTWPKTMLGALTGVVHGVRFNGPLFRLVADLTWPPFAAVFAVAIGLAAAAWCRWRMSEANPAAWAWPMAIAVSCSPVIYPWYLLYLTPFLLTPATIPLVVWTFTVLPIYHVWEAVRLGGRWAVPTSLMVVEYTLVVCSILVILIGRARGQLRESVGDSASSGITSASTR
jgi:alpha-1,6-mannosyltransferase